MRFLNFLSIIGLLFFLASCSNSRSEHDDTLKTCGYDFNCAYWTKFEREWNNLVGRIEKNGAIVTDAKIVDKVARAEFQFGSWVDEMPVVAGKRADDWLIDDYYKKSCNAQTSKYSEIFFQNGGIMEWNFVTAKGKLLSSKRITSCEKPE